MIQINRIAPAAGLLLAACSSQPAQPVAPEPTPTVVAQVRPPAPATPAPPPPPLVALAPDSAEAAAAVVARYHALIGARDYAAAYALWEPGAAGVDAATFAARFARFTRYAAEVGPPGRVDAGAGQRYVNIPVRVSGTRADGSSFAAAGEMTLHRTADIDGAMPEQRTWRIRSSDLAIPGDATSR